MNTIKLTINRRELDFTFGLGFLGELLEELDISIDEVITKSGKNPFKWIPLLMFHSASYSINSNGGEIDFTLKELIKWIEQDKKGGVVVTKFTEAFLNSLKDGLTLDEDEEVSGDEEDVKKK